MKNVPFNPVGENAVLQLIFEGYAARKLQIRRPERFTIPHSVPVLFTVIRVPTVKRDLRNRLKRRTK